MRYIILFIFFASQLSAQKRVDQPLPRFSSKPYAILKKGVTGWSYSKDGQWLSDKKTIPVIDISRNEDAYESRKGQLGLDNFEEFHLYPTLYGKDTLVLLVKIYNDGAYRYDRIKKGWDKFTHAYFYLFDRDELEKLDQLRDSSIQLVTIDLLDAGEVKHIRASNLLEEIGEVVNINPDYDRELQIAFQPLTKLNRIRFQFYSLHKIFRDVAGVRKDYTINGASVYGTRDLFRHLYYEADIDLFASFFLLPAGFEFR